jgi:hypothetical protein
VPEIINDLVILGLAVPEQLKDGRITVCLGGWSPTRGFIRIYPTRVKMDIHRWDVIRVEVERNERDSRSESWKIAGASQDWECLYQRIEKVGRIEEPYQRREIVVGNVSPCVNTINAMRGSLGIIRPREIKRAYFGENPQYGKPIQLTLFTAEAEEWAKVKRDYKVEPRLSYVCSGCEAQQGYHDQKVLEWGFFEWMRKNPANIEQVWENAKLYSEEHEIYLFVGNQAHQRTSFLIISVLPIRESPPLPRPAQKSLF